MKMEAEKFIKAAGKAERAKGDQEKANAAAAKEFADLKE
jgi:hypothetical protein